MDPMILTVVASGISLFSCNLELAVSFRAMYTDGLDLFALMKWTKESARVGCNCPDAEPVFKSAREKRLLNKIGKRRDFI